MFVGDRFGKLTVISCLAMRRGFRLMARCDCGKLVDDDLSQFLRGKRKSCRSRGCVSNQNLWKFGVKCWSRDKDGYLRRMEKGKYVYQHRQVAEEAIGRRLSTSECVHHINGVKDDNRAENLEILTRTKHGKLHKDVILRLAETESRVRKLEAELEKLRRDDAAV